jgi:translocation and assembly module TamB
VTRRLRRALIAVAVGVAIIAGALAWLVATPSGLSFAFDRVAGLLPGEVRAGTVEGRLIGPIVLGGVVLDTETMHIEIDRAELDWHPLSLIERTFDVERFALTGVEVTSLDGGDAAPFELPQSIALPLAVEIRRAAATGVEYYSSPDATPFVLERVGLGATLEGDEWRVHDIEVAAPLLSATGQISLVPHGDYATEASLDWTLRPSDYPPVSGKTSVSGTVARLVIQQTIAPPYGIEARLVVTDALSGAGLDGQLRASPDPMALGLEVPGSISASASIDGSLSAVGISARADLRSQELTELGLALDATYSSDELRVRRLHLTEPGSDGELTLAGSVGLAGETDVALDGNWRNLSWPPAGTPVVSSASGMLRLSGTVDALQADLSAKVGSTGELGGTVRRNGEQLSAQLSWHDIAWPAVDPEARSKDGELEIAGTLGDYRLDFEADLALSSVTSGHVRASGTGSLKGLDLERLDADVLGGHLSGRLAATWSPTVSARAELTAEGLDPGVLDATWAGRIGGRIEAAGRLDGGGVDVQLTRLTLDGRLRDRRLDVDVRGRYANEVLALDTLDAKSGDTEIRAEGTLGEMANLSFDIASPDLEDLWPSFSGRLDANGRIEGPREMPRVTVDATASSVRVPDAEIGNLMLAARVDVSGSAPSDLELTLEDAVVADTSVATLRLTGSGDAAAHELSLTAETDVGEAELALSGSVEAPWKPDFLWRFELDKATLAYPDLAPWTLQASTAGSLSATGAELERSCWQSGRAELCLDAEERDGASTAALALTGLPFAYFEPLLPESVGVDGELTATAELQLTEDQPPRLEARLMTTPGEIGRAENGADEPSEGAAEGGPAGGGPSESARPLPRVVQGLTFGAADGRLVSNGERTTIDLTWPFEQQGRVALRATLDRSAGRPLMESPITGEATAELDDLSFLADVVDQLEDTKGALSGRIELRGTLESPRLVGRVALEDATATLTEPGITVTGLRLALTGDGSGNIGVAAEAQSGGGTLAANGSLSLAGIEPVGDIAIEGSAFELYDTSDARVFVSPDLRFQATPDRITLTGTVAVPRASITPQSLTEGAVAVSPDQVIVDENGAPAARAMSRPLYARIDLRLGDDVAIDGFGLTGELAGGLQITEVPMEPTTATGEIRVEQGTYEAYGQKLDIRRGRLMFAGGPITRPGLDIEAVRQATQDILVGARVRGTLAQPELSLFSEPPLPQQEQLSYLVLGRSLENASTSETSALSNAAVALGLKGGNFVSERLNRSLGFQEFGIETKPGEGTESASFVIGKYLSPSLYVSYGVGLFQSINTLTLRYTISSRWRLETESSAQSKGGDLIYHIERGQ